MTIKRWIRWAAIIVLSPVVLLLLIQITAPLWLDTAAVKAQIAHIIASATGGRAQYQRIDLRFLPAPRAVISELRFDLPGTVEVEAHSAAIDIRLLPLFHGSVEPRRLRVASPTIKLVIPPPAPDTQHSTKPFALKDADAQLRAVVGAIEQHAPGLAADISNGHLELDLANRPPLILQSVDISADVSREMIDVSVALTTPWVERLRASVQLSPADLAGTATVNVARLDAAALGGALGQGDGWPLTTAIVSTSVDVRMRGVSDAQATISASAPRVVIRSGKLKLDLAGLAFDAGIATASGATTVTLKKFALASPSIGVSGTLTRSDSGTLDVTAQLADLDLTVAQSILRQLAPAAPALQGLPVNVTRGALTGARLESHASNIGGLFALPAMRIVGKVESTDLTLTVFHALPVRDAQATVALSGGKLHAENIAASVGASSAHDGTFDIDLIPAVSPLRGTLTVGVDLAQALGIAGQVLGKDSAATLGAITELRGGVAAQATISGNVNTVIPRVDFSQLRASANYASVPFPIHIVDGAGSYTTAALSVRGLRGEIGHSTFEGIDAGVALAGPTVITATHGSVRLALPELFTWAASQPKLAKQLDSVRSVGGALAIAIAELSLPVKAPGELTFRASAVPEMIVADAPHYGPRTTVNGGVIHVTEKRVNASDVRVSALDASVLVSGGTENYRDSTSELLLFANGQVGLDALDFAFATAKLPPSLKLRNALVLKDASVSVRRGKGIGANGVVSVAGGPEIEFYLTTEADHFDLDKFMLRDSASNVKAAVNIDGADIKAQWTGRLAGSSIDHMFAEPPVRLDFLSGDLRIDGDLREPKRTRATGTLTAAAIHLPGELKVPVVIDRLDLEARDTVLLLRTAAFSSGASRATVSGSVAFRGDKFIVDATVRGDTVEIPVTEHEVDSSAVAAAAAPRAPAETNAEKETKFIKALHEIPVEGSVRVDIGFLRVGRMDIAPLQANGSIEGTRVDLTLTHAALCGIGMAGGLVLEHDTVDVHASLAANNEPLAGAIACLSNQHIEITGNVTVNASVRSRGAPGTVVDNLRGGFTLTAKNGRINKFDELARVLKVLNVTQVLVGQGGDFGQGGMAYNTASIDLLLQGPRVEVKSFTLDASGLDAGAHGHVDFATGALDIDALVAPVKTANWVISHIPVVRNIFGGTIFALPVHIGGTISKPVVVPLGAQAVGGRLFEIMGNTLKLPATMIKTPGDTTAKP